MYVSMMGQRFQKRSVLVVENIGSIEKCQCENNRGKPDFARGNSLGKVEWRSKNNQLPKGSHVTGFR